MSITCLVCFKDVDKLTGDYCTDCRGVFHHSCLHQDATGLHCNTCGTTDEIKKKLASKSHAKPMHKFKAKDRDALLMEKRTLKAQVQRLQKDNAELKEDLEEETRTTTELQDRLKIVEEQKEDDWNKQEEIIKQLENDVKQATKVMNELWDLNADRRAKITQLDNQNILLNDKISQLKETIVYHSLREAVTHA